MDTTSATEVAQVTCNTRYVHGIAIVLDKLDCGVAFKPLANGLNDTFLLCGALAWHGFVWASELDDKSIVVATAEIYNIRSSRKRVGWVNVKNLNQIIPKPGLLVCMAVALAACGPDFGDAANLDSTGSSLICLGDSITEGYGATAGNDYPAVLSRLMGRPVLNAGVSGDTTGEALRRLGKDVLSHDPRVVIVELSGNDLLHRIPAAKTFSNLDRIVSQCVQAGSMVVLVHCKFGLLSDPYRDGFEEIADRHGAILVRNALRKILGNPRRMSDQVHPNDEGYALLAQRVAEVLTPLLEAAESLE